MTETPDDIQQQIAELEASLKIPLPDSAKQAIEQKLAALRAQQHAPATQQMQAGRDIHDARQIYAEHYYEHPEDATAAEQPQRVLRLYLSSLGQQCNAIALGVLDQTDAAHQRTMHLADVYIGLLTTTLVEKKGEETGERQQDVVVEEIRQRDAPHQQPLSALAMLAHTPQRRAMLLGAPGSGKSTFVNHLTFALADVALAGLNQSSTPPQK
jgi:DNA segregation ATPase FtsK/SpoIIIE-like protein